MIQVTDSNFQQEVQESDLPVVIDFWAGWCGPCRMMAPVFEEVSKELAGKAKFVKIDTDATTLAGQFRVRGIPSFVVVKGADVVAMTSGAQPKGKFKQWVESNI